jgi:hypothetical protein
LLIAEAGSIANRFSEIFGYSTVSKSFLAVYTTVEEIFAAKTYCADNSGIYSQPVNETEDGTDVAFFRRAVAHVMYGGTDLWAGQILVLPQRCQPVKV